MRYLTDENHKPVAVVIEYRDWLVIERQLEVALAPKNSQINALAGRIKFPMDAMEFQNQVRDEWER